MYKYYIYIQTALRLIKNGSERVVLCIQSVLFDTVLFIKWIQGCHKDLSERYDIRMQPDSRQERQK